MTSCDRHNAHWTGHRTEHCCSCGQTFTGTTAGDRHRVGGHAVFTGPSRRRCLTADEMLAKGMDYTINAHGTPIWGTGRGQKGSFWLAQDESAGLADEGWGNVPPASSQAVTEMDGVA